METGLVAGTFIQPPTSLVLKQKGYNILVHAGDHIELPVIAFIIISTNGKFSRDFNRSSVRPETLER